MKESKIKEEKLDNIEKLAREKIYKKDCLATNDYLIDERNINFSDELVNTLGGFDVSFIEFAPKVFNRLRKTENIDEDELIE